MFPSVINIGYPRLFRSSLAQLLQEEMDDLAQAMHASAAWSKLLMVQLDVLLAGYVSEVPTEPTAVDGT